MTYLTPLALYMLTLRLFCRYGRSLLLGFRRSLDSQDILKKTFTGLGRIAIVLAILSHDLAPVVSDNYKMVSAHFG